MIYLRCGKLSFCNASNLNLSWNSPFLRCRFAQELRQQLATQILSASRKETRDPKFVFRPPPDRQRTAEEVCERRRKGEQVSSVSVDKIREFGQSP